MPSVRERVVRGRVASEHLVHLFDEPRSLVETVAAYLFAGWKRDDTLLVVARAANWALTAAALDASNCPVAELTAAGRLVFLDAPTTLATFLVDDDPDPKRFHQHVGSLVHRLCSESPNGLTAYGEMVDILAGQGNYNAAEQLERMWNELSAQCSFRLLCGYTSAHFTEEQTAARLKAICDLHTHSSARADDVLATWLLSGRRSKFHTAQ